MPVIGAAPLGRAAALKPPAGRISLDRSFITGLIRSSPLFDNFRLLVVNFDQLGACRSVGSQ